MIMVLKKFNNEAQASRIDFFFVDTLVRVYDLPLKLKSESTARRSRDSIRKFVELDFKFENPFELFLRIKVKITYVLI